MRLRVTAYAVADPGRRLRRILTPAPPLRNTRVHPIVIHWGSIWSSRADILRLGALARLAAVSPHTVVHVPAPSKASDRIDFAGRAPTALVLAREDAGLRLSDWPRLRARTHHGPVPGTPKTVTAPAPRSPGERSGGDRKRFSAAHPERMTEYAGTLFVTAHPRTLFALGDSLTDLGETIATDRHIHKHGESLLADVLPDMGLIAVEPIFHKSRWRNAAQR